jgi:hypothetical protein
MTWIRQKPSPLLHITGMELSISHLPDDTIHISGFVGEDIAIMELNVVPQIDSVLRYGSFVWMI